MHCNAGAHVAAMHGMGGKLVQRCPLAARPPIAAAATARSPRPALQLTTPRCCCCGCLQMNTVACGLRLGTNGLAEQPAGEVEGTPCTDGIGWLCHRTAIQTSKYVLQKLKITVDN